MRVDHSGDQRLEGNQRYVQFSVRSRFFQMPDGNKAAKPGAGNGVIARSLRQAQGRLFASLRMTGGDGNRLQLSIVLDRMSNWRSWIKRVHCVGHCFGYLGNGQGKIGAGETQCEIPSTGSGQALRRTQDDKWKPSRLEARFLASLGMTGVRRADARCEVRGRQVLGVG
jgi:hypothetical protein